MRRRTRPDPRNTVPRITWVLGELEVSAPADWTAAQVLTAARAAPVAVRRPPSRSIAYFQKNMETIEGHRWCGTRYAMWREDAPYPSLEFRPEPVPKQTMEGFIRGRAMARRVFPWRLARVDEPLLDGGALFVRADAQGVRIHRNYAPWWPLVLEQGDDPRGMIRVSRDGEALAYVMPFLAREKASA